MRITTKKSIESTKNMLRYIQEIKEIIGEIKTDLIKPDEAPSITSSMIKNPQPDKIFQTVRI